jgi:hypothetical protein
MYVVPELFVLDIIPWSGEHVRRIFKGMMKIPSELQCRAI